MREAETLFIVYYKQCTRDKGCNLWFDIGPLCHPVVTVSGGGRKCLKFVTRIIYCLKFKAAVKKCLFVMWGQEKFLMKRLVYYSLYHMYLDLYHRD